MIYRLPKKYKCPQCKYEMIFSPDHTYSTPVIDNKPICPQCWYDFIKANLPLMKLNEFSHITEVKI